jgi:GNAT superfamily N-acetyltransferase
MNTFESLAGLLPGGAVEYVEGFTITKTGIQSPDFNVVFALDRPESLGSVRERIESLFIRGKIPWQLITTAESSEYVRPLIDNMNLVLSEVALGMVLRPLPDLCPPPPKEFEIHQVEEPEQMDMFIRTADAGFGDTVTGLDVLENRLMSANFAFRFRGALYLGCIGGKPVATSLCSRTGEVAGIYIVSTLPEFRGRGFGEAMVWRAVMDSHEEGCTMSCLQASKMGRPVYERMGYRTIIDYHIWRTTT